METSQTSSTNQRLKTVEEVSISVLGCKPARTYELIRSGVLTAPVVVKLGERQIRINEPRLREWIENGGAANEEN